MNISDAQKDMRYGFYGGGVGVLVSGIAWFISGIVALVGEENQAVWALLIGGALIAPVSGIITKAMGRPDKGVPGNPLIPLAWEGTLWLIFCLPLAYVISQTMPQWFFPAMLLVIGGRYLTFKTLYGMQIYWVCGFLLSAASCAIVIFDVPFGFQPFIGASIEIILAPFMLKEGHKEEKLSI